MDEELNELFQLEIGNAKPGSKEMEALLKQYQEFLNSQRMASELQSVEQPKDMRMWKKFDPDTVLKAATNLVGILLVLNFEKMNIATSKAFNFIKRVD